MCVSAETGNASETQVYDDLVKRDRTEQDDVDGLTSFTKQFTYSPRRADSRANTCSTEVRDMFLELEMSSE